MTELWDVYNEKRIKTGKTHLRGVPLSAGEFHLVVQIWMVNSCGEVLLTRRHPEKTYGNLWECTGGSVLSGEDSLTGALREVREEVGIALRREDAQLLKSERRKQSFYDIWLFHKDFSITEVQLQPEEVTAAKWVTRAIYEDMARQGQIVPIMTPIYDLYHGPLK